jgi:hypothetical protein
MSKIRKFSKNLVTKKNLLLNALTISKILPPGIEPIVDILNHTKKKFRKPETQNLNNQENVILQFTPDITLPGDDKRSKRISKKVSIIKPQIKIFRSLYKKSVGMSYTKVFAIFPFDKMEGETWETPFGSIVEFSIIEEEDWTEPDNSTKYPILINYLNNTFLRAQHCGLIAYSRYNDFACFNTGLLTRNLEEVLLLFKKNDNPNEPRWKFLEYTVCESQLGRLGLEFPSKPRYHKSEDLQFDPKYKIELRKDFSHLWEGKNRQRYPDYLLNNPINLSISVRGAIASAETKAKNVPSIAIPQWYDEKPQLLLPLSFNNDFSKADVVLVLIKDRIKRVYKAETVLTLHMAYKNARLIGKPTAWLEKKLLNCK